MRFAEYYHLGLDGIPRPMCGSDAVLLLDGRWAQRTCLWHANKHAAMLNRSLRKGIVGFTLNAGESFSRSVVTLPYRPLPTSTL